MNEKSISQKQLFFVVLQAQIGIGIGILSLPSNAFSHSKNDGWISVILAGIGIQLLILLLWALLNGFKGKSLFEISIIVFGPYVGKVINLLYTFYVLLFTCHVIISTFVCESFKRMDIKLYTTFHFTFNYTRNSNIYRKQQFTRTGPILYVNSCRYLHLYHTSFVCFHI